jgi:hypothetical protein
VALFFSNSNASSKLLALKALLYAETRSACMHLWGNLTKEVAKLIACPKPISTMHLDHFTVHILEYNTPERYKYPYTLNSLQQWMKCFLLKEKWYKLLQQLRIHTEAWVVHQLKASIKWKDILVRSKFSVSVSVSVSGSGSVSGSVSTWGAFC